MSILNRGKIFDLAAFLQASVNGLLERLAMRQMTTSHNSQPHHLQDSNASDIPRTNVSIAYARSLAYRKHPDRERK